MPRHREDTMDTDEDSELCLSEIVPSQSHVANEPSDDALDDPKLMSQAVLEGKILIAKHNKRTLPERWARLFTTRLNNLTAEFKRRFPGQHIHGWRPPTPPPANYKPSSS